MNWLYEVQHVATATSLVLAGVALTVVPRLAINVAGSPGLAAIPIVNPGVARTVGVVTKRGLPLSPPGEFLLRLISTDLKKESRSLSGV